MGSSHVNDQLPSLSLLDCTSLAPQATSSKLDPTTYDLRMALLCQTARKRSTHCGTPPKRPLFPARLPRLGWMLPRREPYSNIAVPLCEDRRSWRTGVRTVLPLK